MSEFRQPNVFEIPQINVEDYFVDIHQENYINNLCSKLAVDGLVTFNGISNNDQFLNLAKSLGPIIRHRDSDKDGLTLIAPRDNIRREYYLGFGYKDLLLHIDGSGNEKSLLLLLMYCSKQAISGGWSILSDGKEIYSVLQSQYPHVLKQLQQPASVVFGNVLGLLNCSIFTSHTDGHISIRFRADNQGFHSTGLCHSIGIFLEIAYAKAFRFKLKKGWGYILNNTRWLHGRTRFIGTREMYRTFVDPNSTQTTSTIVEGFRI